MSLFAAAIAHETLEVMPVSTLLTGQYGISDVCLSLPCVIGRAGILRVLEPELSEAEMAALRQCAQKIRELIEAARQDRADQNVNISAK